MVAVTPAADAPTGRIVPPDERDRLVEEHLGLARHLARRFSGRGESLEDLTQVAYLALVKAADRYDPERGVEFGAFATPTVLGEIKRHFRDKGWAIRVPRQLQELRIALSAATDELTHELSRSPSVGELAHHLGVSEDDVIAGLECGRAYSTQSLDPLVDPEEDDTALAAVIGTGDPGFESVENRQALRPLLADLPERERNLLELRFFQGMTQTQIAAELGISQMHVSRLLTRTLNHLRTQLLQEG
jgi:RNA polymerase sigma-B factor